MNHHISHHLLSCYLIFPPDALLMVVRLARLLIQRCGEILTPFLQKRLIGILAGNESEEGGGGDGRGAAKRRKTNATKKQNGKKGEEDEEDNDDDDNDDETEEDGGRDAADKAAVVVAGDGGGGLLRGSDALSAVIKVGRLRLGPQICPCGYLTA